MNDQPTQPESFPRNFSFENLLLAAALLIGLFLRLFRLGLPPLNDLEASWALQALQLAHQANPLQIGGQPGYVLITSLFFFLFKDANGLARLLPALAGSLLVSLPILVRPLLPRTRPYRLAVIILAFALAVDPALVALSRRAGSAIMAISFSYVCLALVYTGRQLGGKRLRWAAIFGALALLSGPSFFFGLLTFGLILLAWRFAGGGQVSDTPVYSSNASDWIAFGAVFFLVGTSMLRAPQGLAGFALSLQEFLQGLVAPSGVELLRLPAALVVYQPAALVFGLFGAARVWFYPTEEPAEAGKSQANLMKLLTLAGAVFFVTQLAPSRQMNELAWAMIPLWSLAAYELGHHLLTEEHKRFRVIAPITTALVGFFLVLGLYYQLYLINLNVTTLQWALLMVGIVIMACIVLFLIGAGWNIHIMRFSLVYSSAVVMTVWMLSSTWGMAIRHANSPAELWSEGTAAGQVDLLSQSIKQLSSMKTGHALMLDIVTTTPSPALRWALREFPNTSSQSTLSQNQLPAMIVTSEQDNNPALLASYRGQDFDWVVTAGWSGVLPPDPLRWMYTRSAPAISQKIILWVRGDVFPGGAIQQPAATP